MSEKLPPQAIEAEIAVIGSMMLAPELIPEIIEQVGPTDFYRPNNAALFSAIIDTHNAGVKLDAVTIQRRLRDRGELDDAGGTDAIVSAIESTPSGGVAGAHHARIVRQKSDHRRLLRMLDEAKDAVENDGVAPAAEHVERIMGDLLGLGDGRVALGIRKLSAMVDEVVAEIRERAAMKSAPELGVMTGIADLDYTLCGLEPGTLTIIAARTSMGKTSLALQIAEHMAMHGSSVGMFCLEMNQRQLVYRQLASKSGLSAYNLRRALLPNEGDFSRLDAAAFDLRQQNLFVCIAPGLTVTDMRSMALAMKQRGVGPVFIDHLGLMRAPRAENRNLALGEITAAVKNLASELAAPIVLLCQLNREAERRGRPQLMDLRESGHIEEDADNIILIHRPEFEERRKQGNQYSGPEKAELVIAKNRQGPVRSVDVYFDAESMVFKSTTGEFP